MALRTPADVLRLRRAIATADALSIVGGGATGVQLAGAAAVASPRSARSRSPHPGWIG